LTNQETARRPELPGGIVFPLKIRLFQSTGEFPTKVYASWPPGLCGSSGIPRPGRGKIDSNQFSGMSPKIQGGTNEVMIPPTERRVSVEKQHKIPNSTLAPRHLPWLRHPSAMPWPISPSYNVVMSFKTHIHSPPETGSNLFFAI
jgi:hypothetical protein